MTSSEAITQIMRAHIAGIRQDAADDPQAGPPQQGLEPDRAEEIATRLDRINMRLDELGAFVLAV